MLRAAVDRKRNDNKNRLFVVFLRMTHAARLLDGRQA